MTRKKNPKPVSSRPPRLMALRVEGRSVDLSHLFPVKTVPVAFPELAECRGQLVAANIDVAEITSPWGTPPAISNQQNSHITRLLYEHRILMEIRHRDYYKPVLYSVIHRINKSWFFMHLGVKILSPTLEHGAEPEHERRARLRDERQPLGPFLAEGRDWKIEPGQNFDQQIMAAEEFCASRNLLTAVRRAGSVESFINQTVEKYLAFKFGGSSES